MRNLKILLHYNRDSYNRVRIVHAAYDNSVNQITTFPFDYEGEKIDYLFSNVVPHNFNGHFNTLDYSQKTQVLKLYKRFN